MACLQHHKHIVCEKPFVANHEQVVECLPLRKNKDVFNGQKNDFYSALNQTIQQMIQDGAIRQLRYITE